MEIFLMFKKRINNQSGFTLVKIAIVMFIIIGLLIGGILTGQAMIQNAKVKSIVKQVDEIRAAVMSFYDKYGVYPGDENKTTIPSGGVDTEGDGDGIIEAGTAEDHGMFLDLQLAGLISGSYNGTSGMPYHALGDNVTMYWKDPGPGTAKHYFLFYNLPAEVCLEIDSEYDDGGRNSGSIIGSTPYTDGTIIPIFYILF